MDGAEGVGCPRRDSSFKYDYLLERRICIACYDDYRIR